MPGAAFPPLCPSVLLRTGMAIRGSSPGPRRVTEVVWKQPCEAGRPPWRHLVPGWCHTDLGHIPLCGLLTVTLPSSSRVAGSSSKSPWACLVRRGRRGAVPPLHP